MRVAIAFFMPASPLMNFLQNNGHLSYAMFAKATSCMPSFGHAGLHGPEVVAELAVPLAPDVPVGERADLVHAAVPWLCQQFHLRMRDVGWGTV